MEDKKLIIIAGVIVAIIAIVGVIFATGIFNTQNQVTTPFETDFMAGSFVGNVTLINTTDAYVYSYKDNTHNITYNITTVDNSSALMDVYSLQGITNPDERTFNGFDWNIYYTQAVPTSGNETNATNNTMNIVICQSQGKNQGYIIYVIFGANSDVKSTGNEFGEAYKDYVEPLLKTISLKESENVPAIYEQFGMSESEFYQQINLIQQYNAGNYSALEG